MEHKYILNLIYQQPNIDVNGKIDLLTKTTSLGYTKYKDALDAYEKFNRRQFIEFDTNAGKVTFNVISVELVNKKKLEEFIVERNKQREEDKLNEKTQETTEEGSDAGDVSTDDQQESENVEEVFEQENSAVSD